MFGHKKLNVGAVAILLIVVGAMVAACAAPPAAPAQPVAVDEWGEAVVKKGDPIKLGFSAALSGAGIEVSGIDEKRGAEMAAGEKEVLGFKVQLVSEDDVCSAEGGTTVANKFVADTSIAAVVGHMCSGACLPASDIYQEHKFTMVSPSCTAAVLTARNNQAFFRVAWNDKIQGPAAAKFLREVVKVNTVATIHDGSTYGEGLVQEMAKSFAELGGTVVAQEAVNVGDTDMRPLLERLKAKGAQALYYGGALAEGAYLASQRLDVGMSEVVFMGADGISASDFITAAGEGAAGVYASAANPAEAGPGSTDFVKRYKEKYGEDPTASFHFQAYDAAMVILNAIEKVGQVDAAGNLHIGRKALNDQLRATKNYQGLSGMITCEANGDCGTGTVAVSQVKDGKFQVVWP